MGKFRLIQRGHWRTDPHSKTSFLSGRDDSLIDPDYMGAAEFEFGAIPMAYRRIFAEMDKYKLFITPLKTQGGAPFCLFCKEDKYNLILESIKNYLDHPYPLKEWSNMHYHFTCFDGCNDWSKKDAKSHRETDFWWCIDRTDIGDWIAFIGAADRQNSFKTITNEDYKVLWEEKSPEEKEEILSKIY